MSMKRIVMALAGLAVFAMGAISQPGPGERWKSIHDELGLSDQQEEQIEKLRSDHQKTMIDQRGRIATARVELRDLLRAEALDRPAIDKKMQEIANLEVKAHSARLDHWAAVNKILTPEQQKLWKKTLTDRGRRGMGPGMRRERPMRGDCCMPMEDEPGMQRRERIHR